MTATVIHTIGHSNHPMEAFVALLRAHGIAALVDVRSRPYSRWAPHFRKRVLAAALEASGVRYLFLGEALGGRPSGDDYYAADGSVDYARRARSDEFLAGIERLLTLARQIPSTVMCAEEDPRRCHRRALIAPALRERGVEVVHLRGDGRAQVEGPGSDLDGQLGLFT